MNDAMDDFIDDLLRDQFEGPVRADGFAERVIERLPARRHRIGWPLAAGVLAGIAMCWFSLSSNPLVKAGWQAWLSGGLSPSTLVLFITMLGMAMLALAWTIAEADDQDIRPSGWIRR